MQPTDLAVAGLTCDIVGALFLSRGLMITRADAEKLELAYTRGAERSAWHDPAPLRDRLRQSRNASVGLLFLSAGFCLQLLGYVLPRPQIVEAATGPAQLAAADLDKIVVRNVRPAGDSVSGSVYNGTGQVVTKVVVAIRSARFARFVLAGGFAPEASAAVRADLARASRTYEVRVHVPPLSASRFSVPVVDGADTVTGWKVVSAEGTVPR